MRIVITLSVVLFSYSASLSLAVGDHFGSGTTSFEIEFISVGYANNPADTADGDSNATGVQRFGKVGYKYWMGKYEISESMVGAANVLGGIGISTTTFGSNKPAGYIDWNEAARFVNWLNVSKGLQPAYKYDSVGNMQLWAPGDVGYDSANITRNRLAKYFLPTDDEWYKAAYFNPVTNSYYRYATSSNDPPIGVASGTASGTAVYASRPADITSAGGLSPLGTMAQTGNITEWLETQISPNPVAGGPRHLRGNNYSNSPTLGGDSSFRGFAADTNNSRYGGFRVIKVVPEPTSLTIFCIGSICLLHRRWRIQMAR